MSGVGVSLVHDCHKRALGPFITVPVTVLAPTCMRNHSIRDRGEKFTILAAELEPVLEPLIKCALTDRLIGGSAGTPYFDKDHGGNGGHGASKTFSMMAKLEKDYGVV